MLLFEGSNNITDDSFYVVKFRNSFVDKRYFYRNFY